MAISEQRQQSLDRRLNRAMAVILPLLEAGGLGYATYVIIYLVCIHYLINPPADLELEPRRATGIALLVIYCVLLLLFCLAFLRLLQVMFTNPGFVPLGDPSSEKHSASTKRFDRLDAYICDYQGYPIWCERCHNWKPDRTHHSSQLGRCVRRMDHFCPYAGGIISQTTHKFFVQFLFYGFLYTGYVLIVMAVFLAERIRKFHSSPATWVVLVALGGLFFLFTFGMFMTTFYQLAVNRTTVEEMNKHESHNIALLGRPPSINSSNHSNVLCEVQRTQSRSFIVLQTQSGENPWDRGWRQNIASIMGDSVINWFNPLKHSPCLARAEPEGEFAWGMVVTKMMQEYGVGSAYGRSSRRSHRRRKSRSTSINS